MVLVDQASSVFDQANMTFANKGVGRSVDSESFKVQISGVGDYDINEAMRITQKYTNRR